MGILNNLVIATSGTLPHDPKQIRSWIERNGGRFSPSVTQAVTHMIASKAAYKQPTPAVQQAADLDIPIVSYDWFDDSLQARRKLGAKKYLWSTIRSEKRTRRELKRRGAEFDGKKFREGCARIRELTKSGTLESSAGAGVGGVAVVASKPKKSRSFFFSSADSALSIAAATPSHTTPFVSAKQDLLRRRAERDAAATQGRKAGHHGSSNATTICSSSAATTASEKHASSPSALGNPTYGIRAQAKTAHWKDEYHYYQDVTGFEYKIVLVRTDYSSNSFAQYHVGLLESHAKPHTYWAIAQFKPAKAAPPASNEDEEGIKTVTLSNVNEDGSSNAPHPEATRLTSLVTKPAPTPEAPYMGELCPRNSSFAAASRAFRHAFRDLTLLSWEERFADVDKTLQKARAQHLNIEPFLYSRPKPGMPMGLLPQAAGMFVGEASGLEARGDIEDGYFRGVSGLPGIEAPLSVNGTIGHLLERERQEREKQEEEERKRLKGKGRGKTGERWLYG